MTSFVIYDSTSGAVRGVYMAAHDDPEMMASNTPAGCAALEVDPKSPVCSGQTGWTVVGGVLQLLPPTPAEMLAAAQAAQSNVIDAAYQTHIDDGFTSSALGESYLYPSTATDQANLTAVITASMIPTQPADWTTLFWCAPAANPSQWNYLPHTAPQIHQVGLDALSYIMAMKMQRAQRNGQIAAATTVAAVQAIAW